MRSWIQRVIIGEGSFQTGEGCFFFVILVNPTCRIHWDFKVFLNNQDCETLLSVHVDLAEQLRRDTCKVVGEISSDGLIFKEVNIKVLMKGFMVTCVKRSQRTKKVSVHVDWRKMQVCF